MIVNEIEQLADRLASDEASTSGQGDPTLRQLKEELDALASSVRSQPVEDAYRDEPALQRGLVVIKSLKRAPRPKTASCSEMLEGESLREYKLLAKLGEGGMGAVYRALHTKLDKIVALKVVSPARIQDEAAVRRFEREMKAIGRFDHPNIVQATDAGEVDGRHFLVMELVDGIDLSRLARTVGPLPVADACELIRQAAMGLQVAHNHGLIHRDIKPSNLMLAGGGRGQDVPTLKILDLGLALLSETLSETRSDRGELTATGQLMGTLEYMSPEQVADSHEVDIRSDIYSLGATLYSLLCGQPPFAGPKYGTASQMIVALATQSPPSIGQQRPDLPEELVAVVDRMLAKQPDNRFATPEEVAVALTPFAAGAHLAALLETTPKTGEPARDPSAASTHDHVASGPHHTAPAVELPGCPQAASVDGCCPVADRAAAKPRTTTGVKERAANKPSPAVRAAGLWKWIPPRIGIGIVGSLGGVILLGLLTLFIPTKDGTIIVEIDDPTIQVTVEGENLKITKDQSGGEYTIKPGKKTLHVMYGELAFDTEKFELRRGEKIVLAVKLADGQVQVKWIDGQDARVIGRGKLPPEAPGRLADRRAAEWVLSLGGSMTLDIRGKEVEVNAANDLPSETWNVRSINLSRNRKVTDAGLKELAGLTQLQSLDLSGTRMTDAGLKELAELNQLQSLWLSATHVTDAGLKELAGLERLQKLGLHATQVTGAGLTELAGLKQLRNLDIANAPVTDAGWKALAKLTQLTALWLNNTPLTDARLKELAGLRQTQVLSLSNTQITDAGLKELAGLTELHVLLLNSPEVTDAGLKQLVGLTKLRELRVYCPNVTDAGLKELAKLRQLWILGLNNTQVTDAGLKELTGIKHLRALFLDNTHVTEAGLKEIAGLKNLRNLSLNGDKVTEAGVAELKIALPGCQIQWGPADGDATAQ